MSFDIIRKVVSGDLVRYQDSEFNLNLTYITNNIIAMSYPASSPVESAYRNDIKTVAQYLNSKHNDKYMVFNLSQRPYDSMIFNGQVLEMGWPDHHAPPLLLLFDIIKSMDAWFKADPANVAVVHCLAGRGRTGVIICCYMVYSGYFECMKDALEFYAAKRSAKGQGVTQPSQLRYARYFDVIFNKAVIPKPRSIQIDTITIRPVPSITGYGGIRPVLKIYLFTPNSNVELYSSDERKAPDVPPEKMQVTFRIGGIVAKGDIMIKLFHAADYLVTTKLELVGRLIFHTGFIGPTSKSLKFRKNDIDTMLKNSNIRRDTELEIGFHVLPNTPVSKPANSVQAAHPEILHWDDVRFESFWKTGHVNRKKIAEFSPKVVINADNIPHPPPGVSEVPLDATPNLTDAVREDFISPIQEPSASASASVQPISVPEPVVTAPLSAPVPPVAFCQDPDEENDINDALNNNISDAPAPLATSLTAGVSPAISHEQPEEDPSNDVPPRRRFKLSLVFTTKGCSDCPCVSNLCYVIIKHDFQRKLCFLKRGLQLSRRSIVILEKEACQLLEFVSATEKSDKLGYHQIFPCFLHHKTSQKRGHCSPSLSLSFYVTLPVLSGMQGVFGRLAQLALLEQEGRWREEPHNPKLGSACKHRWVAFFTPYELAKVYCEKNEGKGDVDMETAKLIWNAMRKYEGFIPLYTPKRKIAPSFSHGAACYGFYHDLFRPDDKEASHNIRLKAGMLPPLKKQRADEVRDDDTPPVIRLCSEAGEKWKQEAMQVYGWTTAEADNALDRLFAGSDETREIICSSAYYYDTLSVSTMQPVPVKGSIMFFINKNSTTHFCVQYSPESTGGLVERYVNIKLNPQAEFIVEIHETTPLSSMVTRKAALTSSSATTTTISRMTWTEFAEMCTGLKEPETAVADDLELELVKFQAAVAQLKPSSIPKLGRGARPHRVAVKGKS